MTLKDSLSADMKAAMKESQGKEKLSTLRLLKSAIQYEEIEKGHELSDEEVLGIITREIKKRQDVIPDYRRAGREEAVNKILEEISFLQNYLPQQLTETEVENLVMQVIRETGARGPKDMGVVMKAIMPKTKGRADGKTVNHIVKRLLEAN